MAKGKGREKKASMAEKQAQQALNQVYYQQAKAFKDNADNILYNGSVLRKR